MIWIIIATICALVAIVVTFYETHMQTSYKPLQYRSTVTNIIIAQILFIIAVFVSSSAGYNSGYGTPTEGIRDGQYQLVGSIATIDRNYIVLSEVNAPEKVKNLVVSKARILLIKDVPESEIGKVWVYQNTVEVHMNTWTDDQFSDNVMVKTRAQFHSEKKAKKKAEEAKKQENSNSQ